MQGDLRLLTHALRSLSESSTGFSTSPTTLSRYSLNHSSANAFHSSQVGILPLAQKNGEMSARLNSERGAARSSRNHISGVTIALATCWTVRGRRHAM